MCMVMWPPGEALLVRKLQIWKNILEMIEREV